MNFPLFLVSSLLCLCISQAISSSSNCTTGVSIVAPELAVPGKTTAIFVTFQGPLSVEPVNVTIKLEPEDEESTQEPIETVQEIKSHGILPLEIPSNSAGQYILKTIVNSSEGESCILQSTTRMRLVGNVRDVIIRPARHTYRPGEIIEFWILALDHDLQIVPDSLATVSVKDPQGSKVGIWGEIQLNEGVRTFSLPISEYVRPGRWTLLVEVDTTEFSAQIDIVPGFGNGLPDVAAAEEHYVELRFGRDMRRRYKPGLPFSGKVEAMSTEKSVRVRVKVYDNMTAIYSQDIEISNGEGTFVVPAILADSDTIALQAELVSVESKEIESHYVLAKEQIKKWNSTTDCYLLIEGIERTLLPEDEAHVDILSTCPCERDLHYVITTDGRVTDWAQRRYEDPLPLDITAKKNRGGVCKLNFSFTVRALMAPISQLLVYYVTNQGEPVSDVINFDVKLLNKQVYVNVEDRDYWLPNQPVDLDPVVAELSSLVCLLGGKSSGNDLKFDPRISEERYPSSITGEVDFLEAGLSFFQRQCLKKNDSKLSVLSYRQRGSGAGPSNRRKPPESLVGGTHFDQLWLWKCFNYTSTIASSGLTIQAPQEPGKWSVWALTVSNSGGLRFSPQTTVNVFRPLEVEFRLPNTIKVRETLEVDVKIVNNINACMDVTALLALSEGAQFLSNGLLYVTERLRLGPNGATSLVVRLLVTTPGLKNLTVEVNGYSSPTCEGTDEGLANTTLVGAVVKSSTIKVLHEGTVRVDTESAYFCANENIIISNKDNFKYEWIKAPRNRENVVVEVKIDRKQGPVHLILSEGRNVNDKSYKITIGDVGNTESYISRGKHDYSIQLQRKKTKGILSRDEWRTFWLSWDKNILKFGSGSIPNNNNNTLLSINLDRKIKLENLGFSSNWGTHAEFRVWNFNDEAGYSQVLHLETPKSLVPGSESGRLIVSSGLALKIFPKLQKTGDLSSSIASLTGLICLDQLKLKNQTFKDEILKKIPGEVQNILSYRKPDNSFSEHRMLSSHKTTVSVLEILLVVRRFFNIDPDLLQGIKKWIQLRQEDNGSFLPLPADINLSKIMDGNETKNNESFREIVQITARTVIILLEIGIESDEDSDSLQKAKIFLENSLPNIKSNAAIATVTFALVLMRSATSTWAIEKLRNASTTEDNEFGWPFLLPKRDAANWLYESESGKAMKESPLIATLEDYEASIYALATFCVIGDVKFAESVTRYLFYRSHMLDKHPELLYSAAKAIGLYDSLSNDKHRVLTISLATSGMELTDTLDIKGEKPEQIRHLPSLPTKVFVYATGGGCATVQGRTTYSTYSTQSNSKHLNLYSSVIEEINPERSSVDEIEGKLPMLKLKTCFKWKNREPSGILRLEINLFSGFELSSSPPPTIFGPLKGSAKIEMEHGSYDNQIWFVFANVTGTCPICVQYLAKSSFVISSLRPAYARIFPVVREDLGVEMFFHAANKSTLMKGITDDDVVTWFGGEKRAQNELKEDSDCFKNIVKKKDKKKIIKKLTKIDVDLKKDLKTGLDQEKQKELVVNMNVSPPRHINTKIHEVPGKLKEKIDSNDDSNIGIGFPPENKNDKYILLDKDELWGLLKEVVNNKMVKSKLFEKQR
nr:C3 and PZP-like alpha-2-macroglobulin domain-containing protein 8 [Onthophagus taurus]